jgi:DNA-binding GntR family transcriptional regulator
LTTWARTDTSSTDTGSSARELFELRAPLEGRVARLAAERRTPVQLDRLRRIVERGQRAAADRRLDTLPDLNTEFHGALAAAADNDLLAGTLARLSDIIRWIYAARISRRSTQSWLEHAAIVASMEPGDAVRAERCGADHISAAAYAI